MVYFLCRGTSGATSAGGVDSKRQKITIWPEWSETDINAEKWVSDILSFVVISLKKFTICNLAADLHILHLISVSKETLNETT